MSRIVAVAFAALLLIGSPGPAAAEKWDLASGYPESNFHTQNINQFAQDVKQATGGKLELTVHSNQALFKLAEIKRAVQSRQVPIGEVLLVMFGNEDPFYEVSSIPFLADTYPSAKKLWDVTKPLIAERLGKQGIRLLYGVPWPPQAFYTKTPLRSVADLKGVKARAYNPVTARMAELMGAIPATVPQPEVPQAFSTGLVGMMYTSGQTGVDTQAWDFTRHVTMVGGNHSMNVVFANEGAFRALPADVRQAVLDAAARAEARGWKLSQEVTGKHVQILKDKGMTVTEPSPQFRGELQKVGATLTEEWLKKAGEAGQAAIRKFRE
ncbi:MAG: TRAP transporter substrate-binding protein [Candidatus Rokubacteria bacterium]|nr:TRAP transporter substrate-binding protein [Candidatus Rokubacteria bacterium]